MIKPVKRNKRLKWIDSRYAHQHRINKYVELSIGVAAADWCVPIDMLIGTASALEPMQNDLIEFLKVTNRDMVQ